MMILAMLLVGLLLSALFSGSETGFYRVSRVRLVLDGLDGDRTAERLLWMTNNPSVFIATTLVGNNVANYITSLAIVLGSHALFGENFVVELLGPILLAPFLFVYGESLPKSLFLLVPNLLLKATHSIFLLFAVLFAPVSALLWLLGRALQRLLGCAPETVRMRLARDELKQVLHEGQQAGLLKSVQHELAQLLFSVASEPIGTVATPLSRLLSVSENDSRDKALRMAKNARVSNVAIKSADGKIFGYKSVADLRLQESESIEHCRPMLQVNADESFCSVLIQMQTERESMAMVVDEQGEPTGIISESDLSEMLEVNFGARRSH